jgi:hypothetical protein
LLQLNSQLARDIAGVRGSVSSGNILIPKWDLDPVQQNEEVKKGEIPWWINVLIFSAAVIGAASMYSGKNEYMQTVQGAMENSLGAIRTAARWFYGAFKESAFVSDVLWPFVRGMILEPGSAQGAGFTIFSYLLTLSAPDFLGIIGVGLTMLSIYIGPTTVGLVLAVAATILTIKGIIDLIMKERK